jgi:hypothetical protein
MLMAEAGLYAIVPSTLETRMKHSILRHSIAQPCMGAEAFGGDACQVKSGVLLGPMEFQFHTLDFLTDPAPFTKRFALI